MIKLWGRINSINVQKCVWCLAETGLPFERIDTGGVHGFPAGYEQKNPYRRIPLMELDGATVWESNTIVRVIASKAGRHDLYPVDVIARSYVDRWLDLTVINLEPPIRTVFLHTVRGGEYIVPQTQLDAAIAKADAEWNMINDILAQSGKRALNGKEFSIADIVAGLFWYRWKRLDALAKRTPPQRKAVDDWWSALSSRPSFRSVDISMT